MNRWRHIDEGLLSVCTLPTANPLRPATITTSTTTDTARDDSQHQTVQGGTYDSEVLRIHDDSELMTYWFHLPLLVYHSKFAGLEVTWFPYSNKRVPSWSTNASRDMFNALEYWIYNGRLQLPLATRDPIEWRWLDMPLLYDLWVFADNYGIPGLGNDVIDKLHERLCSSRQLPGRIKYAYDITRPGQMLREFIIDFHCFTHNPTTLRDVPRMTADLLRDCNARIRERGYAELTPARMTRVD